MHNKEKNRQQCRYTLHTQTHTMHNSQEFSSAAYTMVVLHYEGETQV